LSIRIEHIEYYLPDTIITNNDLVSRFPHLSSEEIYKTTGVKERRHTTSEFIMSDMAIMASNQLLSKLSEYKNKIDALILVGHGFDYKAPVTAAILQHKLGLKNELLALDLPGGCTGYINGLAVAKGLLESHIANTILLVTGDTPSYVIAQDNSELLSIFGDSSTTTLLTKTVRINGLEQFLVGTDGNGFESLLVHSSGGRLPHIISDKSLIHGEMTMNGKEIFLFAIRTVPQLIANTLQKNGLHKDDIAYFVFHQANSFMLDVLRRKLKIEKERFFNDIRYTGNTVSSSIPIALKTLIEKNKIKRGDKILLAGFGLGYTWGATVIEY
jgi:3-oxoacyl-[acyl-carrier-protein] synthase III